MADWPWKNPVVHPYKTNPIITSLQLPDEMLEGVEVITDEVFASRFEPGKSSLKTWGRTEGTKESDPHYIGVRRGTTLHTDRAYPRYTHQIILRCDGFTLRGQDKVETQISRGTFFILDTHSPHQLFSPTRANDGAYVALSIDSKEQLPKSEAIKALVSYGKQNRFSDGA